MTMQKRVVGNKGEKNEMRETLWETGLGKAKYKKLLKNWKEFRKINRTKIVKGNQSLPLCQTQFQVLDVH